MPQLFIQDKNGEFVLYDESAFYGARITTPDKSKVFVGQLTQEDFETVSDLLIDRQERKPQGRAAKK